MNLRATSTERTGQHRDGAVLLEVVLALVLFAAAATVIGIGLNSSISSVERLRLSAQAADLSVTVFSELQLGIRSLSQPEEASPGGTNVWTIELEATPWGETTSEAEVLTQVELTLRHQDGFVHRAMQVMKLNPTSELAVRERKGRATLSSARREGLLTTGGGLQRAEDFAALPIPAGASGRGLGFAPRRTLLTSGGGVE